MREVPLLAQAEINRLGRALTRNARKKGLMIARHERDIAGVRAEAERLAVALIGMMVLYGMDEDRDNGACAVTWDAAREALASREKEEG